MKIADHILPAIGVGMMAMAVVSVGIAVGISSTRPPPMKWESMSVANSPTVGEFLIVRGKQNRLKVDGCSNTFQADMRHDGKLEVRLPVPTRSLSDNGAVEYDLVLPPDLRPGPYEVHIRESFNCGRGPVPIDAPWLSFVVR